MQSNLGTPERLIEFLKGHCIGLAGYGQEGRSTYRFLSRYGLNQSVVIAETEADFSKLSTASLIFRSPGIHPLKLSAFASQASIVSQTSLVLRFYHEKIVAVTGTKGKSTTSSALAYVLRESGRSCIYTGNIGIPHFDCIEQTDTAQYWVMELSAQQLMDVEYAPAYALWLNLYPEHLDYFETLEAYAAAKKKIIGNTTCIAVISSQVAVDYVKNINDAETKIFRYGQTGVGLPPNPLGKNYYGFEYLCKELGIDVNTIQQALAGFKALPSRLEKVATYEGVSYVSDCLATIPESVLYALSQLKKVDFLILGGKDRGLDYVDFFSTLNQQYVDICLLLVGETSPRFTTILEQLSSRIKFHCFATLTDAVTFIKQQARAGDVCLLAPGAPSYDSYKNYLEKHQHFCELVGLDLKIV